MKKLLSAFLLIFILILGACSNEEPEKEKSGVEDSQVQDEVEKDDSVEDEVDEPEEEPEVDEVEETEGEESSSWDDIKDQEKIIGVSDKDFLTISKAKPSDVNNDVTGNWRKVTVAESFNIEEYALSYADNYIKDGEIHFIINFNDKTTTRISNDFGMLSVTVHEYVDKEEHDAKKMPSGMVLKDYVIYPDGDIEEI